MAYDVGYPGNQFRQGKRSTLFGGGTATEFGGNAWLRLNGVVKAIEDWLLDFFRRPFTTGVCIVQEAVSIGDVLVADMALTANDADGHTAFYVRRLPSGTGATNALRIGIALEAVPAFSDCHYAAGGMLPANLFTGLTGLAAGSRLVGDVTTGRLRAWTTGDDTDAYVTAFGAVFLLYPGRLG